MNAGWKTRICAAACHAGILTVELFVPTHRAVSTVGVELVTNWLVKQSVQVRTRFLKIIIKCSKVTVWSHPDYICTSWTSPFRWQVIFWTKYFQEFETQITVACEEQTPKLRYRGKRTESGEQSERSESSAGWGLAPDQAWFIFSSPFTPLGSLFWLRELEHHHRQPKIASLESL